jgi:subtilisin family serine protease
MPTCAADTKHTERIQAYQSSLLALREAGVLVFAAAGNEQVDNDDLDAKGYANVPCNVPLDNVIAIGATDKEKMRWSEGKANEHAHVKGSNFGANTVDLGAPGARIVGAQASAKGSNGIETRYACTPAARATTWRESSDLGLGVPGAARPCVLCGH